LPFGVRAALGCAIALAMAAAALAADTIALLPGDFTLDGPAARQHVVVERQHDGQNVGAAVEGVTFVVSDPKVLKVEEGRTVPLANGRTTLTATVDGQSASIQITVANFDLPTAWSFRNHVEPVLARAGCNSGACHGALAGKKGFRLTLRGFDPQADYNFITRQARARRIVLEDPGRSLLLTKPSGAIPHRGGLRFTVDSLEYQVLSDWIAAGAPAPQADDPRMVRLEIFPRTAVLKPGDRQQLIVRAHFSDGRVEDVTRWSRYSSTNESVAAADTAGLVRVIGHGEGAISASYLSANVVATISSAFVGNSPADVFAAAPRRNFIDELVLGKLLALNLPPSPPATDAEFVRRAFIDTIGLLPTADEARSFIADPAPDKRDKLVETLLARPEFVDYWAYKWSDLLLVSSEKLKPAAMWAYHDWIRNQVANNTPWDVLARSIVTATGSTLENGAANFFVLHQDPAELAETTSLAFLGMSINCAKCHNHPLEKWTNDQYYGMANLFARVRTKDLPGDGNRTVFPVRDGELVQPRTGKPQPPCPLDGTPLDLDTTADRREHLASWLVAPQNPYFSRAITNRVWANFFGVGLVEHVDDLRLTNPASNEPLLAAAARFLVDQHYDLKALMRAILQSETYRRSSQPLKENEADTRFYSRYYPRRLMAEVLLDALSQVTAVPTTFPNYPAGRRAIQLPDANVTSYFLKSFGRPIRQATCECERTAEPSMVQVLHLSNGDTVNQKLEVAGNRIDQLLKAETPNDQLIDQAYLAALSRYPTDMEKERLLRTLADANESNRRLLIEDLYWGILTSKEFLFNR
jgi:hypothetical protein